MSKLFEAMAEIKLTTENIQKVIKMFPRDNDWKNLITKHRRDIDALRRGKDLPQKVEDELFNWALDNNEIKTDDVEELEDFIDRIMNEGTFEIAESVPKAVQGLNDLGNKMKGRDQKDIRRIEKLYRSGNKKVFQGAIRALDTDLRDQVKDIFDALDMVKNGVIESVDLDEGKMKRNPLIDNNPDVKAARKAHADGTWDGNVDKEGEAIVHIKGKPYTVTNKFESVDLDEAKKLGSRVKITKGRFAGKEGIIRQMDNGRFKGADKSFDIDLDNGKEANGVPGKDIKIVKESVEEVSDFKKREIENELRREKPKKGSKKPRPNKAKSMGARRTFGGPSEEVEEAKAPKMKGVSIKGSEVTGLRAKDGKLYSAKPLISGGKLSYRVEDEFGAFDTIPLKKFAAKFG